MEETKIVEKEQNEQKSENTNTNEQQKPICKLCGCGFTYVTDPNSKKLISLRCKGYDYDSISKKNIGCDFVVYSDQKLFKNRKLSKADLKNLVLGQTLRIEDFNVFVDPENPSKGFNKRKEEVNYYLKLEKDQMIEEDL